MRLINIIKFQIGSKNSKSFIKKNTKNIFSIEIIKDKQKFEQTITSEAKLFTQKYFSNF